MLGGEKGRHDLELKGERGGVALLFIIQEIIWLGFLFFQPVSWATIFWVISAGTS
jgi:hypothetical protein